MVDLVFVLDRSGSVSKKEFNQVKQFMRNFLEYFSVAVMHTQVKTTVKETKINTTKIWEFATHPSLQEFKLHD